MNVKAIIETRWFHNFIIAVIIINGAILGYETTPGLSDSTLVVLKVLDQIWRRGEDFLTEVQAGLDAHPVGAELSGIPPMFFITFRRDAAKTYKKRRTAFYTQLIRRGVFLQPYHHGYICWRHTEADLGETAAAIGKALESVLEEHGEYRP